MPSKPGLMSLTLRIFITITEQANFGFRSKLAKIEKFVCFKNKCNRHQMSLKCFRLESVTA
jgi:hypothetical protein